jgi:hypothetical protein
LFGGFVSLTSATPSLVTVITREPLRLEAMP